MAADDARTTLEAAVEEGVTFFDTADVYGDGRSEQLASCTGAIPGCWWRPRWGAGWSNCPRTTTAKGSSSGTIALAPSLASSSSISSSSTARPTPVFENDAVFEALDEMVSAGRMHAYGVSVETCAQALAAIARPHVASVQIILNCFRLKPLEEVLPAAQEAGVGILARVPLASGLLSGRYDERTVFAPDDHRSYTDRAKRSTSARRSPVFPSSSAWPPSASSRPCSTPASRCPVRAALGDRPAGRQHRDSGRA